MLCFPKKLRRRADEVCSGFAAAELRTVREELRHPSDSTEAERARLRDPRGFAAPVGTSVLSGVGVYYLARCLGIARRGHVATSAKSYLLGVCIAGPYMAVLALSTTYYKYA